MTTTLPPPVIEEPADPPAPPRDRTGAARLFLGRNDAAWIRPSLITLLVLTAVLYIWGLGASGWGNAFYSAAVQAGSESWKAFFYGSSDAANAITVDKTPAALWIMALSVRVFGLSSWSILVPQALLGVATTGLLYATVRRAGFGPAAGLLAGAISALTPVAVLMFRFNNPDALLVLLMVAGAYATLRAVQTGSTKWVALIGVFVGFAFLAKMLQALLVVPAFGLAYLIAGPPKLGKRLIQLVLALVALVVSAGWYIAIVELVPASMRPYIGGSQNNSLLELTLGYNGLGRLNGDETGSVGGGGGGGNAGGMWGEGGPLRLFESAQGGQISWLLPAALILLVAGLVITARRARTDAQRAALIIWGGWLMTTALVFSFMQGIFHAYYTVALAPAIGGVVAMGATLLWERRRNIFAALTLGATIAVTAWWSYTLLARSSDFLPWLRLPVLIAGIVAAVAVVATFRLGRRLALVAATVAAVAGLAGPAAYAVQTASEPHTGSIPSAGPAVAGGFGGGPGGGGGRGGFNRGGGAPGGGAQGGAPGGGAQGGAPGGGAQGGGFPGGNQGGGFPGGGQGGAPGGGFGGQNGGGQTGGGGMRGGGGGMGGLLNAVEVSDEMKTLLEANADQYTWVAAAIGSQSASGYQLATEKPVMAVGGFNGTDPSPTLEEFQKYVTDGKIHYFIGGGSFSRGGGNGGSSFSSQISEWVAANYTAKTVDSTTIYDLTSPTTTGTA
ncbi:4-amino-4-deoxy-L-arabinose transferase-like glycosyltransferase [Actinoplanes lutulentus]|uniref:4-amino-4-deoxy-L-arabinose transferase-like glycosyltransferase n=1 Tax=Actinoplanes lutulentus TaxID=1287878 RepID=A0A327ZGX8_9ACTN|nr:glycosyltransferase family 39 protein [Actinoplanes lutulentus]MBB2945259.1 4-amino-4-deoxy-L-arabinose transferase-like glycosyltransferase [Actinoplanes lutulentus]RAK40605.1 4-amino-4-deoxy-L-arabinose transferase-like glycosyltransferase [Actinoplanes lutulentus]